MADTEFIGLQLSADDVRQLTGWGDAMVEDYISIVEALNLIQTGGATNDEVLEALRDLVSKHVSDTDNPHATSLENLIDTLILNPTNGDLLVLENGRWINRQLSEVISSCCKDLIIIASQAYDKILSGKEYFDIGLRVTANELNADYVGLQIVTLADTGFSGTGITYDNKSFGLTTQFGSGNIYWHPSGTSFWSRVTGTSTQLKFQRHHLATAWDVSTVTSSDLAVTLPAVTSSGSNLGVWWISADGLTLVSQGYDDYYQFDMTVAFDLSTATYTKTALNKSIFFPRTYGVALNNETFYLWQWQSGTSRLYKYNVPDDNDVDTIALGQMFDYETIDFWSNHIPRGIMPSGDGSKLFLLTDDNFSTRHLLTYSLLAPYDISVLNFESDLDNVFTYSTQGGWLSWNQDGSKCYDAVGGSTDVVFQYSSTVSGGGVTTKLFHDNNERFVTLADGIKAYGIQYTYGADAQYVLAGYATGGEPTPFDGSLIYNNSVLRPSWYDGTSWKLVSTKSEHDALVAEYDAHVAGTADRHDATMIDFDGAQIDEPSVTNLNELALYENEEISMRETAPSAQISGGYITVNVADPNYSVDVPAGTGEVVDAYTDRTKPTRQLIGWNPVTIDLSSFFAPNPLGVVTIYATPNPLDLADSTINVVQNPMPNNLTRTNILLAYVFYHDGIIDYILDSPRLANEVGNALYDFIQYFPPEFRTQGVDIHPVTTPPVASIWNNEGRLFHIGSNVQSGDPTNPNILAFPALGDQSTPAPFDIHLQDGSHYASAVTTIPNFYESAPNVITNLTGNKATIHYVYRTVGGDLILQLGQFTYNTGKEARDNVETDAEKYIYMVGYQSTLLRAQIYYQRNTADFTDPIKAGVVNLGESSGGAGASTSVTTFLALTDVFETTYVGSERLPVAVNDAGDGLVFDTPKVHWRNIWVAGAYLANDMVIDGQWTMIANKDTTDRPAPQPQGEQFNLYEETASFLSNSATAKQIIVGQRYSPANTQVITGFRLYGVAGQDYVLYLIEDPLGAALIRQVFIFTATRAGWLELNTPDVIVRAGTTLDFVAITSEPDPTPTTFVGNWNYTTVNNLTVPVAGEIQHGRGQNRGVFRISKTDSDATDRSADLATMTIGDHIQGTNVNWAIQSVVDNTTWYEYLVAPETNDSPTGIKEFTFESINSSLISYNEDVDHWLSEPSVSGLFIADGAYEDIIPDNTQYFLDVKLQSYLESPDWDIVSTTGDTQGTSGGGGGGDAVWGGITGTLSDQTDLQAALDAKVNKAGDIMTGNLNLLDNVRLQLGTGADLLAYHNGGNGVFKNITGGLFIESLSNTIAAFTQSAAKLYFESSQKLETLLTGIGIAGDIIFSGADRKIVADASDTAVYLAGGIDANPINGAYVYAEGIDYGAVGAGGNLWLVASLNSEIFATQPVYCFDAPTDPAHLTRKDYTDKVAEEKALEYSIVFGA